MKLSLQAVMLLAALNLAAQPSVPTGKQDFHVVKPGETVAHRFAVRNESAKAMRLRLETMTAPGMTVRFKPTVLGGEEISVEVRLDTAKVRGKYEGMVVLAWSDEKRPPVTLVLEGEIRAPIEFKPFGAIFISAWNGEAASQTITLVNHEEAPLKILETQKTGERFEANVTAVRPGREYAIIARSKADTPPGRYEEMLYLHTDKPGAEPLRVVVRVLIKRDLHLSAETVDFGSIKIDTLSKDPQTIQMLTQTIVLSARSGGVKVISAQSDLPFVGISCTFGAAAKHQRIDVSVRPEELTPGVYQGSLRIKTDNPAMPELAVPITAQVSER